MKKKITRGLCMACSWKEYKCMAGGGQRRLHGLALPSATPRAVMRLVPVGLLSIARHVNCFRSLLATPEPPQKAFGPDIALAVVVL